jgi:hypothetical protein
MKNATENFTKHFEVQIILHKQQTAIQPDHYHYRDECTGRRDFERVGKHWINE